MAICAASMKGQHLLQTLFLSKGDVDDAVIHTLIVVAESAKIFLKVDDRFLNTSQMVKIAAGGRAVLFYFESQLFPDVTSLTVMVWPRIAPRTSALTAHLTFI